MQKDEVERRDGELGSTKEHARQADHFMLSHGTAAVVLLHGNMGTSVRTSSFLLFMIPKVIHTLYKLVEYVFSV